MIFPKYKFSSKNQIRHQDWQNALRKQTEARGLMEEDTQGDEILMVECGTKTIASMHSLNPTFDMNLEGQA